jgi:hypothetical protein
LKCISRRIQSADLSIHIIPRVTYYKDTQGRVIIPLLLLLLLLHSVDFDFAFFVVAASSLVLVERVVGFTENISPRAENYVMQTDKKNAREAKPKLLMCCLHGNRNIRHAEGIVDVTTNICH